MTGRLPPALRTLARNPLEGAIGVAVLALGFACLSAAYLLVSHVRSADAAHVDADRAYVIMQSTAIPSSGYRMPLLPASTPTLAEHLELAVPELEAVARYGIPGTAFVTVAGEARNIRLAHADPELFAIFDYEVVAGDPRAAAAGPDGAVISDTAALALFGTTDVVGRPLTVTSRRTADVTIGAVVRALPRPSHLAETGLFTYGFDVLVSWDVYREISRAEWQDSWGAATVLTYVLLPENGSLPLDELDRRLAGIAATRVPPRFEIAFAARPISSIVERYIRAQYQGFAGVGEWRFNVLDALLLFAGAILAVACANFVNLATARALGRTRAIGTHKVLGATAGRIAGQELARTAVLATLAAALALAVLEPLDRVLHGPWRDALSVPWTEPRLALLLLLGVPAVTLAAGAYPALLVARVRAAAALRQRGGPAGSARLRSWLVGVQFAAAALLLALVWILLAQRDAAREAVLGRFADPYVVAWPQSPPTSDVAPNSELIAAELRGGPGILGVTATSRYPFEGAVGGARLSSSPSELDTAGVPTATRMVGYDYFTVMDVPLLAGRAFSREYADGVATRIAAEAEGRRSAPPLVIDRAAARALGFADPEAAVGRIVYTTGGAPREIVGVVETLPATVRADLGLGSAYELREDLPFTIVRIAKGNVAAALEHIDAVFARLAPNRPPASRVFLDDAFENVYRTFAIIDRVFTGLALLALSIAAAGLYGMASYMTQRRVREIGLRKTQGATAVRILRLLLWDFSRPVLLANLIAWPVAYVAAGRYLEQFATPIPLTPLPFVAALAGTLALAWLAVGRHALRAARLRPTDALRHE